MHTGAHKTAVHARPGRDRRPHGGHRGLLRRHETVAEQRCSSRFRVTVLTHVQTTVRRLVYLAIKELCERADDVIIVTSSLTKDMTGREDMYRAPAIRALCRITDVRDCGIL